MCYRQACACIGESYRCHESVGLAKRPQVRVAMLHERDDAVDNLEGNEELPDNTPSRDVIIAVYVNNKYAAHHAANKCVVYHPTSGRS